MDASRVESLLPREIFNEELYRSILHLWFGGLGPAATVPNDVVMKRWFGISFDGSAATSKEKQEFDEQCRSTANEALRAIGPTRYVLPPSVGFEDERERAATLSAPFRRVIGEYSAEPDSSSPKEIGTGTLTKADIALALILLLDQLPRNVFRHISEQGQIYQHYDRLARALVHCITNLSTIPCPDVVDLDRSAPHTFNGNRRRWFYMPLMHSEALVDHETFFARNEELSQGCEESGDEMAVDVMKYQLKFAQEHVDILKMFGRYPHRNDAVERATTRDERDFLDGGGQTFGTK